MAVALKLTFKEVQKFIKQDNPDIIDAVDKLFGLTLLLSPIVLGPAALALIPFIAVKNEVAKLSGHVLEEIIKILDEDYVTRHRKMQLAYSLISYSAFFDALSKSLPPAVRRRLEELLEAKDLARDAERRISAQSDVIDAAEDPFCNSAVTFPHPAEDLETQRRRLERLYHEMATGFDAFWTKNSDIKDVSDLDRRKVTEAIRKIPQAALSLFDAQYFELCRKYPEFAIWANIQSSTEFSKRLSELPAYFQVYSDLARRSNNQIDVGFRSLHDAVTAIPHSLALSRSIDLVEGLRRHYEARIDEPVIESRDEDTDGEKLAFPKVRDAFVPQSFRVLKQDGRAQKLEDDAIWASLERRNDIGAFLLSYLTSPYSDESPLVILGHPGSGKSLLTTVLAAQLMSEQYTCVRVPLREVNPDQSVVSQIEEYIFRITNIKAESWHNLSKSFKNNPLIVILDGYDELLQASGKVFAGYLKDVQEFQRRHLEQGTPVKVVVTSRVTLIDKAIVPSGSTIVRLLEFEAGQRKRWVSIWNAENARYFSKTGTKKFSLPTPREPEAAKILNLAEQPLLLLMLAIYDSEQNKLRNNQALDRTLLYDSLLRRFILRERDKSKEFRNLLADHREVEVQADMQRLGVAAIGMYNRRKLFIHTDELNADIRFFELERHIAVETGRPLSQADLLLGSFFFVHKSKVLLGDAVSDRVEESSAFEFLHNTFGEFLTADFIIQQAISEIATLSALASSPELYSQLERRLSDPNGMTRAWFACLVYTPLYSRPVVLQMLGEWIHHVLSRRGISHTDLVVHLEKLFRSQIRRVISKRDMPKIMQSEAVQEGVRNSFEQLPLVGHLAIYSLNLVILRSVLGGGSFSFDETGLAASEGTRPWEQLSHLWRSWFSLENLSGVSAVMRSERQESSVQVEYIESGKGPDSKDKLSLILNVGAAIGDDVTAGLAGLLVLRGGAGRGPRVTEIEARLSREKIDLSLDVMIERIVEAGRHAPIRDIDSYLQLVSRALEIASRSERYHDVRRVMGELSAFFRSVGSSRYEFDDRLVGRRYFADQLGRYLDPRQLIHMTLEGEEPALDIMEHLADWGRTAWGEAFVREYLDYMVHRGLSLRTVERNPEWGLRFLRALRKLAGETMFNSRVMDEIRDRILNPIFSSDWPNSHPDSLLAAIDVVRELNSSGGLSDRRDAVLERLWDERLIDRLFERAPYAIGAFVDLLREMHVMDPMAVRGVANRSGLRFRAFRSLQKTSPESALRWAALMVDLEIYAPSAGETDDIFRGVRRGGRSSDFEGLSVGVLLDMVTLGAHEPNASALDLDMREIVLALNVKGAFGQSSYASRLVRLAKVCLTNFGDESLARALLERLETRPETVVISGSALGDLLWLLRQEGVFGPRLLDRLVRDSS